MARDWLIDELAFAGAEHRDPAFVAGYDRKQGHPDADEDLAEFFAQGLSRDSTVIDFGAGTGQFALPAARRFKTVIAVDVSPEMVLVLEQRAAEAGLRNLSCLRSGFLSYEHRGPAVDGVYTRNALHHQPDFFKGIALDRIARVLKPGGVLRLHDLIFDFQPAEAGAALERWFSGASSDPSTGYTAADLAEHVRTEFSTYRWLLEPMLEVAGFEIARVEYVRSVYAAYTCRRR